MPQDVCNEYINKVFPIEMNYFSKNIRFLRNKRGLNQAEMLNHLGFPRTTWSSYENSVSQPDIDGLLKIASFFGVSVTELLEVDIEEKGCHLNAPQQILEETTLKDPVAMDKEPSARAEGLLREIIKIKQQVIESQAQTINALQTLVKHLNSDLMQAHGKKE